LIFVAQGAVGFNPRRFRFCTKNVDGGDKEYDYGDVPSMMVVKNEIIVM